MPAKRVQAVSVRSRDERFAKFPRDLDRVPVRVEQAFVEMAKLNRVKAIHLVE